MLPISVSNVGVREAGMIMLMVPYGVSMTEATTWSVLIYSGPLSCALIGLLLEAEHLWLRKKSVASVDSAGHQLVEQNRKISQEKPDDLNYG
jgi:drug/metabolite transporter (DMT)-like permease